MSLLDRLKPKKKASPKADEADALGVRMKEYEKIDEFNDMNLSMEEIARIENALREDKDDKD